ncbi:MAG: glycosyltransferase family 2 protein [Vicinamibacteria bacterium]
MLHETGEPFFTVITPTYNRWLLLQEALRSALRQTFSDFEILVVDDGSTDGTPEKLRGSGFSVEVLHCERGGPARARNVAIARARGRFLAFLDSDDLWLPHHLQAAHELIRKRAERRFLFSDARFIRSAGVRDSYLAGKSIEEVSYDREGSWRVFHRSIYPEIIDEPTIATSSVVVARELVVGLGGFDERLRPFGEDTDLWLRLVARTESAGDWAVGVERRKQGDNLVDSGQDLLRLSKEIELLERHYRLDGRAFRPRIRKRLARVHYERALAAARSREYGTALVDVVTGLLRSPRCFAQEAGRPLARRLSTSD